MGFFGKRDKLTRRHNSKASPVAKPMAHPQAHPLAHPLAMALEPRFMFDAAGAATGAEITAQAAADSVAAPSNTTDTGIDAPATDSGTATQDATSTPHELVVVDTSIAGYNTLIAGLSADADVLEIGAGQNGMQVLADYLTASATTYDAIHVVSHGGEGTVQLGTSLLTADTLANYTDSLSTLGGSLTAGGDLLFYGCEVGTGEGQAFIDQLSIATGADVAASDDLTGAADLGGDWVLEVTTGSIEADTPFSALALADFTDVLVYPGGITMNFDELGLGSFSSTGAVSNNTADNVIYSVDGVYSIKVDGASAGTSASDGMIHAGIGGYTETSVTLSFVGNETFDVSSIVLMDSYSVLPAFTQFKITSNLGDTYTVTDGNIRTGLTIDLSGFATGLTSLTITKNGGGTFLGLDIDALAISNVEIATNSAPTVSGAPASVTVTEDTAGNVDLSAVTFADSDGDSLTVTLSIDSGTFSTPADGSGVGGGVTETLVNSTTITLAGAAADINTYLDTASNIQYTGASNASGNGAATITVSASDGAASLASDPTVSVNITAVNDAPTAAVNTVTTNEDTAYTFSASDFNFSDVDTGDALTQIQITALETTGVLTLSGVDVALNDVIAVADIGNLVFTPVANANGASYDSFSFKVNDGTAYSASAYAMTIDVTAVNDAPTVSGAPASVTVTEDTESNVDLSAVTFADVDGDSLTVTLSIDSGTFSTPADGSGVGGGVTETLVNATTITLVGAAADINTYLNTASNIKYTGTSNTNGAASATITVSASDGTASLSADPTVDIDITAANDAPTVSGAPASVTVTEDTAGNVDLSAVTFADVEGDSLTVTLSIDSGTFSTPADGSGGGVTETWVNATTITLVGAAADINTYLNTASNIQYTGASNASGNGAATITISASDGTASLASDPTVDIDITAVNDAPTVASTPATVTVTEDTASNVDLSGTTFADVDGDSLTVTLSIDSGTFSTPADGSGGGVTETLVNSTTITLAGTAANINTYLNTASNIQYTGTSNTNGAASATITVSASDGTASLASDPTVDIDITAVNDAPTVSGAPASVTVTEDAASNVDLSAVTFADVDGDSLTVTLSVDVGTFSTPADGAGGGVTETLVNSTTITLVGTVANINTYLDTATNIKYTGASNSSGNGAATITISASDGNGGSLASNPTVSVNITAVNDAPTVSGAPASVTVTEDTASNVDLSAMSFADVDGDSLTVTLTADAGTMTATTGGSVTVTGSGTGTLTLAGTAANINTYLDTVTKIKYTGASNANGNGAATITVSASDGTASLASDPTISVDITAVNDAPTISGFSAATVSGGYLQLSGVSFADVDGDSLTVTITGSSTSAGSEGYFGTLGDGAAVGGGVIETRVSDTQITLVGAAADINTYLDTASNIPYAATIGTSKITITANDGTATTTSTTHTVTGTNVIPTITSATYDYTTGVLVVTGTDFQVNNAGMDIDASKLRFYGVDYYTLTDTADVEITSATQFTLTLSATDKAQLNMRTLNQDGITSREHYPYRASAFDDWNTGAVAYNDISVSPSGTAITASNVAAPSITSATYDAATGSLVVTGSDFHYYQGSDIDASMLTITGEGGATYKLTNTLDVNVSSGTTFTLTLSATDKAAVNQMLNKDGAASTDATTYNLAAADNGYYMWAQGAQFSLDVSDLTNNAITVSNVAVPTITSVSYTPSSSQVVLTGTGFLKAAGAANDIDASMLTFTGEAGATYTLTDTADVEITSGTKATLTLSATDKAGVEALLNKEGTSSTDATLYNLAVAEDWAVGADAAVNVADATVSVTVTSPPAPRATTTTTATLNVQSQSMPPQTPKPPAFTQTQTLNFSFDTTTSSSSSSSLYDNVTRLTDVTVSQSNSSLLGNGNGGFGGNGGGSDTSSLLDNGSYISITFNGGSSGEVGGGEFGGGSRLLGGDDGGFGGSDRGGGSGRFRGNDDDRGEPLDGTRGRARGNGEITPVERDGGGRGGGIKIFNGISLPLNEQPVEFKPRTFDQARAMEPTQHHSGLAGFADQMAAATAWAVDDMARLADAIKRVGAA